LEKINSNHRLKRFRKMKIFSFLTTRYKIPKKIFLFLLSIPLVCYGLLWGVYWFIELRPQYLELQLPPHEYMLWGGYTERSTLIWEDNGDRYYLWRQEAICSKSQCGNWNDVFDYFNKWLEPQGWTPFSFGNPCTIVIPEVEFLERGDDFIIYQPSDIEGVNYSASVCLAIYLSHDNDNYWQIVIGTINPSPITQFLDAWNSV
jgi:hypothetical protein